MYRNTRNLICTVGTSLYGNLINERMEFSLSTEMIQQKYQSFGGNEQRDLIRLLQELDGADRRLGAEINSIYFLRNGGYIPERLDRLVLLVSDTPDGQKLGSLLKDYFEAGNNRSGFVSVDQVIIETTTGLKDDDIEEFKGLGLKNLVHHIGYYVRQFGREQVVINATGGYKAQILFAGVVGQALAIPVYYKHERFETIIELPPLPVTWDMGLWLRYADEFYLLEDEKLVPRNQLSDLIKENQLASLFETENIDDQVYVGLSPLGSIYHDSFSLRFQEMKPNLLPPKTDIPVSNKKYIPESGKDSDPVRGVQNLLEQKILTVPYVVEAHTVYHNPDLPERSRFVLKTKDGAYEIHLIFSNGKQTMHVHIKTTAKSESQKQAAVVDLSEKFRKELKRS